MRETALFFRRAAVVCGLLTLGCTGPTQQAQDYRSQDPADRTTARSPIDQHLHWVGHSTPFRGGTLNSVAAADDTHVYLAGRSAGGTALIVVGNGATWDVTLEDSDPALFTNLLAFSADDVWAVPYGTSVLRHQDYAGHWVVVPSPTPLASIDGPNSRNLLAVGVDNSVLHWDGIGWTRKEVPVLKSGSASLRAIAIGGRDEYWVGGNIGATAKETTVALFFAKDGNWSDYSTAFPPGQPRRIADILALARQDVWVGGPHTLQHFDGVTWIAGQLEGDSVPISINAFSAVNGTDIWAVGTIQLDGAPRAAALRGGASLTWNTFAMDASVALPTAISATQSTVWVATLDGMLYSRPRAP